jgi:transcriptional regulator with XRE-family HTH domain
MPRKPHITPSENHMDSVSLMLRELRFNYGYTQQQLGQFINKSRQSISRAENSKNITLSLLFEIIDVYDMTLYEFFSGIK